MLSTAPLAHALGVVGQAQDGDHERDVGLDRLDDVAGRRALLGDEGEHAVARLGERGEELERLERRGQALAVTLVARRPDERVRLARTGAAGPTLGRGLGSGEGRRHELFIGHWGAILEDRGQALSIRPSSPIGIRRGTVERTIPAPVVYQAPRRSVERGVDPRQGAVAARPARRSRRCRARSSCPSARRAAAGTPAWPSCRSARPRRGAPARRSPGSTAPARPRARSRAAVSASAPASGARNFSRAAGSSTGSVEERARQRPELVERRDLLLRDGDGVAQPGAARSAPRAAPSGRRGVSSRT